MSPHTSTRHKGREALFSWVPGWVMQRLRVLERKNAGDTGDKWQQASSHAGLQRKATGDKPGANRGQSGDKERIY